MKEDLPSPYAIKCINQEFLKNYVKEKKDEHGEPTFYELHGKTPKEMKKYINDLPEEDFEKYFGIFLPLQIFSINVLIIIELSRRAKYFWMLIIEQAFFL